MEIKRDIYLKKLIDRRGNGMVKIVTGIRRCGKSYLLRRLYADWLLKNGVDRSHIIAIDLDEVENERYLDRAELVAHVKSQIRDAGHYYVFLDEIQLVEKFERVLNSLNHVENIDLYVTGSNSKFLSSDIVTEFRGRGDEIRLHPLSFAEFFSVYDGTKEDALQEFLMYGGMPLIVSCPTDEAKASYLKNLCAKVYLSDVVERNRIRDRESLVRFTDFLASAIGALTNPLKLANTFKTLDKTSTITDKTVRGYLGCLIDAYLVSEARRYDVKGKRYLASTSKIYFEDVGVRNARLNFRQHEISHLLENVVYNELVVRGWNVDVGMVGTVETDKTGVRREKRLEVDFVCNRGSERCYVQVAQNLDTAEKLGQEEKSLTKIPDSFPKLLIVGGNTKPWQTENGFQVVSIFDFLATSVRTVENLHVCGSGR